MTNTPCLTSVVAFLLVASVHAADWPGFRGPNHDGLCPETGLLKQLPAEGPKLLGKFEGCGVGYSSVAVVGDSLYTMGDLGDGGDKAQFVMAYALATRQQRWATRIGPPHRDGSRCTPTVDEGRVYALGTSSDLVCLSADSGEVLWKKNLERDFGGKMMSGWRWSESPIVDGQRLVCTPGVRGALMVALNKKTGDELWRAKLPESAAKGREGAGYATIAVGSPGGVRQYATIIGRGAIGVAAETGEFLWEYRRIANGTANISSPIINGDHVFVSTAYNTGAALLKIKRAGGKWSADEVYFLDPKTFQNHHGGMVLVGDHVYAGAGHNDGAPICIELLTGKVAWKADSPQWGSAAVLAAAGRIWFRYQKDGMVRLVEATPTGYRPRGEFATAVIRTPAWAHPAIADGKLYLRTRDVVLCYDVGE